MKKKKTIKNFLNLNDAKIYYEIYGKGSPIFMLHGNGSSHRVFHSYAKFLSRKYKVILVDSRGHGFSRIKHKFYGSDFKTGDMTKDLRMLMKSLKIKKGIILGFSDGANIALEFASRFPTHTKAVISVSGNAFPNGMIDILHLAVWFKYKISCFIEKYCVFGRLKKYFSHSRFLSSLMLNSPDLTAESLSKISAPVLILAGTKDVIKVSHTKWLAANIPNSKLYILKGGTHFSLFNSQKYIYKQQILKFFEENKL